MTPEERRAVTKARVQELLKLDPQVTIKLKGNDYTLEMNNWAVLGILKDTGYNLNSAGFGTEQMQDPTIMGCILFWAMQTHHPDLSLEAVNKLFTYRHMQAIFDKIMECITLYSADVSDLVEPDDRKVFDDLGADPQKPSAANGSATGH